MKEHLFHGLIGLVVVLSCLGHASAQVPSGTGERLAKETMALVTFAEMGNVGARDPECRGTPFPVADVSALVDAEVAPIIDALARFERKSLPAPRTEMLAVFKQIPNQKDRGVGVIQRVYEQKKEEARAAYGADGACAALSSMVQTVIQQKRLALRDINALLSRAKPN
jgi:hypothetical protein